MISGSLAVEGPPRGLGLTVPGHHLQNHHPPLPFVTYHHHTPQPSAGSHHHQLHHLPSAAGSASVAASTWGSVRAMVTAQPPPNVSSSVGSVAVSLSQQGTAQQHKHTEFLMPLPKPLNSRYNSNSSSSAGNTSTSLNGLRLSNSRVSKYSPPAASGAPHSTPVNLVQHKDEPTQAPIPTQEEIHYQNNVAAYAARMLHVPQSFPYANLPAGPYGHALYPTPYTPLISHNPLESSTYMPRQVYNPSTRNLVNLSSNNLIPSAINTTHTSIASSVSSPTIPSDQIKSSKDFKKSPSATVTSETFKVPSGKEGSLKHRILTRPSGSASGVSDSVNSKKQVNQVSPQSPSAVSQSVYPQPRTINNNTIIPVGFGKDSLVRLATGELKRVEDMRTEDFVKSAQHSPELRLADSTIVKIEESSRVGMARITLSYNLNRTQVDFETQLEHPFFIYGQGWASCLPDRTLQLFGIKCHRLQVGDICVTLIPRENPPSQRHASGTSTNQVSATPNSNFKLSGTITTTATTTAMTSRQISPKTTIASTTPSTTPSTAYPPRTHSAEEVAAIEASNARKRRWSAPDQICEEDEQQPASSKVLFTHNNVLLSHHRRLKE